MDRITPAPRRVQPLSDLDDAREYLLALSRACAEGAKSRDPRVTLLALGLVSYAGSELRAAA